MIGISRWSLGPPPVWELSVGNGSSSPQSSVSVIYSTANLLLVFSGSRRRACVIDWCSINRKSVQLVVSELFSFPSAGLAVPLHDRPLHSFILRLFLFSAPWGGNPSGTPLRMDSAVTPSPSVLFCAVKRPRDNIPNLGVDCENKPSWRCDSFNSRFPVRDFNF